MHRRCSQTTKIVSGFRPISRLKKRENGRCHKKSDLDTKRGEGRGEPEFMGENRLKEMGRGHSLNERTKCRRFNSIQGLSDWGRAIHGQNGGEGQCVIVVGWRTSQTSKQDKQAKKKGHRRLPLHGLASIPLHVQSSVNRTEGTEEFIQEYFQLS